MAYDPAEFGHRIRAARVWRKIAPKELAAALGRSDEAVYQLERGDRKSPPDKLLLSALAKELDVTEGWLLGGEEPPWAMRDQPAAIDPRLVRAAEQIADAAAMLDALVSEQAQRPDAPPGLPQAG